MIFYRWYVHCHSGQSCGGYADTAEKAQSHIAEASQLYSEQGRRIKGYGIWNQNDELVLSMDEILHEP